VTRITADQFVADAVAGVCDLYGDLVQPAPGGVVRSVRTRPGKVAVVVGGGSGHYPAFAGYVGPGLADAAAIGNVFASPSAQQVRDIAHAAADGAGVLLSYGNYAGDVLNFGLAAERLRSEGVPTEVLAVTDDIASATPSDERGAVGSASVAGAPSGLAAQRRGIAGDVVVFKVAGAAAEAGYDLANVARAARAANDRTRSFGLAFAGCTLPGASEPLFTVPAGRMGVGLGIHGEPGIAEQPIVGARELAALLADRLLAEAPSGADDRAVALLNGLGATKYEELFVLWSHVARRLRAAGLELVAPEAGELVTSLDMAGCSLTLAWLDDEGFDLWRAPAQTPAFRRGALVPTRPAAPVDVDAVAARVYGAASEESAATARRIASVLDLLATALAAAEDELGRIDAHAGDGDHGRGMALGSGAAAAAANEAAEAGAGAASTLAAAAEDELGRIDAHAGDGDHGRGMALGSGAAAAAANEAAEAGAGAASTLAAAGDAWADRSGGTSGALWGVGLRAASTASTLPAGARAALDAVVRLGGARPGDKTLVDALVPLVEALEAGESWADAATEAAAATAELVPRLGRARPLAERSIGHPDAGAVSLALCARVVASALELEGAQHV
jgi:dihydroxyacetone kinase